MIKTLLKYIVLTALGFILFCLCRESGQDHVGGEVLLLGLPVLWAIVGAVVRPIVADVREILRG